jgi:hypothetical protein
MFRKSLLMLAGAALLSAGETNPAQAQQWAASASSPTARTQPGSAPSTVTTGWRGGTRPVPQVAALPHPAGFCNRCGSAAGVCRCRSGDGPPDRCPDGCNCQRCSAGAQCSCNCPGGVCNCSNCPPDCRCPCCASARSRVPASAGFHSLPRSVPAAHATSRPVTHTTLRRPALPDDALGMTTASL